MKTVASLPAGCGRSRAGPKPKERQGAMLPVGSAVKLEDAAGKIKLSSRVIGWSENECLMLEQPTHGKDAVRFPKNLNLVCRGIHEGGIWGFKANVLFQTMQPYRILFLTFPKEVEKLTLRTTERIQSKIPTIVTLRKHDYDRFKDDLRAPRGVIRNISTGGCKIACPYIFEMNMPLFFSFEVPTGKLIRDILGFIRSRTSGPSENTYGVQFEKLSESLSDMIAYAKIASRIVSNNVAAG